MLELLVLFSDPTVRIIAIVLFVIWIREVITWYWKINRLVKTQETQEDILVDIHQELVEIRKKLDKIDWIKIKASDLEALSLLFFKFEIVD